MEQEFMVAPVCPHCGVRSVTMRLVGECEAKRLKVSFWQCANCGHGIVQEKEFVPLTPNIDGIVRHDIVTVMYPAVKPEEAPEGTPEHIAKPFCAAVRRLNEGNPDDLFLVVEATRRTLEQALDHAGATKGRIIDKIKTLGEQSVLAPALVDWAHQIRLIGNDGAHTGEVTEEDACQAVYFTETLLVYMFTLPAMIEDRKARKSARQ